MHSFSLYLLKLKEWTTILFFYFQNKSYSLIVSKLFLNKKMLYLFSMYGNRYSSSLMWSFCYTFSSILLCFLFLLFLFFQSDTLSPKSDYLVRIKFILPISPPPYSKMQQLYILISLNYLYVSVMFFVLSWMLGPAFFDLEDAMVFLFVFIIPTLIGLKEGIFFFF